MKTKVLRFISLIILLAMIFTTFGCDSVPETTTPSGGGELQGENRIPGQINIFDIEDYNEFLQTHKENLPDGFITADMLKELGIFNGYVDDDLADESCYYFFIHEDKYRLGFDTLASPSTMPIIDASLLGSTMMSLTEKTRGKISINCFEYVYKDGKLLYIHWETNDRGFHLALTELLPEQRAELPDALSEDSILRKLLSKDAEDQIAAYNQLVDMVTK